MKIKSYIQRAVRMVRGEVSTENLIKQGLKVGNNFNRMGGCIIDPPHCFLIEIGSNVTLASRVYILAHDASTKIHLGYTKIGNVKIGNNVFVGANTTILPNVRIGNDVVIGSGSVISKDIPNNSVVVGNPAKLICTLDEYLMKNKNFLKERPIYDEKWTVTNKISQDMKEKMKRELENGIGYII